MKSLLNFRIDSMVKENLSLLKDKLFPNENISDVARRYLKKGIESEQAGFMGETLPSDIIVISRKIDLAQPLTYIEISDLCSWAHTAYLVYDHNAPSLPRKKLIIDNLKAFKDVFAIAKIDQNTRDYYKTSLRYDSKDNSDDIGNLVDSSISRIEKAHSTKINIQWFESEARNLTGLINNEGEAINIQLLNNALRPYLTNLLKLAKYYMRKERQKKYFHYPNNTALLKSMFDFTQGRFSESLDLWHPFRAGKYHLNLIRDINFHCSLYIDGDNFSLHFDFSGFEQFLNLFETTEIDFSSCLGQGAVDVMLTKAWDGQNYCMLKYKESAIKVTKSDYKDLSKLFFEIRDTYPIAIETLEKQWGII